MGDCPEHPPHGISQYSSALRASEEALAAREPIDDRRRETEVVLQQVAGVRRQPFGETDLLVRPRVEDEDKIVLADLLFERPNIVSLDEPVAAFSSGFSAVTSAAMAAPAAMATESAVPAEAAMLSEAAMGKAVTPVAMTPVAVIPVAMVPAMVPAAPAAIVKTDRAIGRIADVSVVSGTRATAEEETDADHERYSPRQ